MAKSLVADPAATGLWHSLKTGTHATHEGLDQRVMAARPFQSRERYGRLVLAQHDFYARIGPLFHDAALAVVLPDLAGRDRLGLIAADLQDLGIAVPPASSEIVPAGNAALGWLYVAEGSNLGAAFLLKHARALGLDETFGARHLAGHSDGRGRRWRSFTTALDALGLHLSAEAEVIAGANAAFAAMREFVDQRLQ